MAPSNQPMDPEGPTGKLCLWLVSMTLSEIPEDIQTRAKYLVLDGLGCALVGAHLPWSEKVANVLLDVEAPGKSIVFGWDRKLSPMQAALINSTFIQGFELGDWHSEAPLHSNSLLIPSLLALLPLIPNNQKISGNQFLLSYILGLETGPRIGNALNGTHILTTGWHSGAVFGPPAVEALCSKLLNLNAAQIEDAIGIACTQACGIMSAQFESEVKRMQHGSTARNGVLGTLLARGGYVGIKKVLEREYGGFLEMFSKGSGCVPQFQEREVTSGLGKVWKTRSVRVKTYASMAATHGGIDCVRKLQEENEVAMSDLGEIEKIVIEMGEDAFHHGGFEVVRPLTSVGAQMCCKYTAVTQLIDGKVAPRCFRYDMLERDEV